MKRFSEQLKKKSESIRLRATERADLRARLESYMEYHPLPSDMKSVRKATNQKKTQGIVSESFKTISINMTYLRGFAGVFALFVVVGIPVIAERSVPGDILYPVKTHFTEEVRSSLTLSPYAKVEWETKRLERRIAEARLLASEGKLTPETEASVTQAIQEHTRAVNQEIATIRETDQTEAAIAEITFASALSVQADVLDEQSDTQTDQSFDGQSLAGIADVIADVSVEAEDTQADVVLSYETLLATVETETTRAYELFSSVQNVASPQEVDDIQRRLEDVERKVTEAIFLHNVLQEQIEITPVVDDVIPVESTSTQVINQETDEMSSDGQEATTTVDADMADEDTDTTKEDHQTIADTQITAEQVALQNEEAVRLLRTALADVQKLIIFMTDIDVRQTVSVQTLVPITLTQEEETDNVMKELNIVLEIQSDIERRIDIEVSDEKTLRGTEILSHQVEEVSKLLQEGRIGSAQAVVSEAHAIAEDVQKMIERQLVTVDSVQNKRDEDSQLSVEIEVQEEDVDQAPTEEQEQDTVNGG